MRDDAKLEAARAAVARIVPGQVNPAMVERAALVTVVGDEVADRGWQSAFAAGESGRVEAARLLRERFGPRNPRRGWLLWLLFGTLAGAALSAVFATGFRVEAADVGTVSASLAAAVALMDLLLLGVAGARPLNFAFLRAQIPTAILMVAAAGLLLTREFDIAAIVTTISAVVAVGTAVTVALVRRGQADATHEIDTALQHAYADAAPVAFAAAETAQQKLLSEIGPGAAAEVVRIRSELFAGRTEPAFGEIAASTPAGGVIVQHLASSWLPLDMTDEWRR
ncbi:hypothetical protein [Microbacterium sp. 1P06AB]|uniref:hypothetical protein n=1 Tax=Microbacterium sp. 1P06AB TaxID=3132289 RepID=UPI0039A5D323